MFEQKAVEVLAGEMKSVFYGRRRDCWGDETDVFADFVLPLLFRSGWADGPVVGTLGFAFLLTRS